MHIGRSVGSAAARVREHTTAAAPPRDAINSWSLQVAARRELIVGDGTLNDGGSDPRPRKHYARLRIGLPGLKHKNLCLRI